MDHREKVDHLIEDLTSRGAWKSNVAPPLFQLLWKLGLEVRPPMFMGFVELLLTMGLPFGLIWTAVMWKLRWAEAGRAPLTMVVTGAVAAVAFAALMTPVMGHLRKKYGLTTWDAYPDGDGAE